MKERSDLIAGIRGEIVGPSRPVAEPEVIEFHDRDFDDPRPLRSGPLGWRPSADEGVQEVLYYFSEAPHRKYGAGQLHPAEPQSSGIPSQDVVLAAAGATDTLGVEIEEGEEVGAAGENGNEDDDDTRETNALDDFEVVSQDVRHPATIGISFCVRMGNDGRLIVRLPQARRFAWQDKASSPFLINGRYEKCTRTWVDEKGLRRDGPVWRRRPAVLPNTEIVVNGSEFSAGRTIRRDVPMPEGSPVSLRIEVFPRQPRNQTDAWLLTVVLRNSTTLGNQTSSALLEAILYQTCFEVSVEGGSLEKYPESQRPFSKLDAEEQSLALLYLESATWGIGHGCAAGWDVDLGHTPDMLYADVMPAVQTPSMTPDIEDSQGRPVQLSMRALAALSDGGQGPEWNSLADLAGEYASWIQRRREETGRLPEYLRPVAARHLAACEACLIRINQGIALLRSDPRVRKAFRLANLAMLLQQIATKQLGKRPLGWSKQIGAVVPVGDFQSPWDIFRQNREQQGLGTWRAFQVAFVLMSLDGVSNGGSPDREVVDLIWFPTGGGKTEAYLGVMAFYLFHQRLLMEGEDEDALRRDGTNALMRYTLRMLTTQQFQRATSLICAMEFLRRNPPQHGIGALSGGRFSLGLWIGGDGSPNKTATATDEMREFRAGKVVGNPLVLTECPWCRAEIGRCDAKNPYQGQKGPRGGGIRWSEKEWNNRRTRGINEVNGEGPLLLCPDGACDFGAEQWQRWLPVEVIDERIYRTRPSLVIATADKLAMIAFRPDAGTLFGRTVANGTPCQTHVPPGLIIQDELHLISGPLGTMYGLYEGIFERLCSQQVGDGWVKPKLIASTATIRGAGDQVKALYARVDPATGQTKVGLFPAPGLSMSDSFFGTYAREDGRLRWGRLYLGIHANDYGSILTTQVRAFSAALFQASSLAPNARDPWWSLLAFYNSIRELGGAKTLFDSDIPSRLRFLFNRENFPPQARRGLRPAQELTSRLSQAEIVGMMDRLSTVYRETDNEALDACLASNIIEVGIDIDRLSLMGVVGQPKTTAQYIQVTGRVGRRWWERPGLILMIYNPSKSRDRSHFEQFHSYHSRLYERVEPSSATPFALAAIQRALPGALIAWARQQSNAEVQDLSAYQSVRVQSLKVGKNFGFRHRFGSGSG